MAECSGRGSSKERMRLDVGLLIKRRCHQNVTPKGTAEGRREATDGEKGRTGSRVGFSGRGRSTRLLEELFRLN